MAKAPAATNAELLEVYRRTVNGVEELLYRNAAGVERDLSAAGGAGVTDHGLLTGLGDDDHTQYTTDAEAGVISNASSAAAIASHVAAGDPHTQYATNAEFDTHAARHANGAADPLIDGVSAPSSQAFGDVAAVGPDLTKAAPRLHKHGMMADPVVAHLAAGDPHTQYPTQTEFDDHSARHDAGGADVMAIDAAAGSGSLRTLGAGALQAASGTDARFTDARTPLAHHASHEPNGSDSFVVASGKAALGSLTLPTDTYMVTAGRVKQSGAERIIMNGTSRWMML